MKVSSESPMVRSSPTPVPAVAAAFEATPALNEGPPMKTDDAPSVTWSSVPRVRVLRTDEEIEGIRDFWSSCKGGLDSDLDVFLPLHANMPEDPEPRVFALYRGRSLVALLAGRVIRRRLRFHVGWLPLFRPLVKTLTVPCDGFLGDTSAENCRELVDSVIGALRRGEADLAFFWSVNADSQLYRSLKSVPGFLWRDRFAPLRPHRKRRLPISVSEFHSGLSSHERKRFRQTAKRLSTDYPGGVQIDCFGTVAQLDGAMEMVEEITKKTWQRALGRGFNIADVWQRQSLRTQAEKGWLRIYILSLAGQPCAYSIGALYHRTFYSEQVGYDPEYASYSPGTFLLLKTMEDLSAGAAEEFDFGPSDEEYKKRFGNITFYESNLHVFAPSASGLMLSVMNAVTVLVGKPLRMVLNHANLIQRVKKAWRSIFLKRAEKANANR